VEAVELVLVVVMLLLLLSWSCCSGGLPVSSLATHLPPGVLKLWRREEKQPPDRPMLALLNPDLGLLR